MGANARKYRADIIQDLAAEGPSHSMFYAVYLAEAMSRSIGRKEGILDQTGLTFRPTTQYGYQQPDVESIRTDFVYRVTDQTLDQLSQLENGAEFLGGLAALKGKHPFSLASFTRELKRMLPEENIESTEKDIVRAAAIPSFSFVFSLPTLYGPDAAFPRCYHQEVVYQQNEREPGQVPLQNFLDLFNNRIYWLYYQAWKKYRLHLQISDQQPSKALDKLFAFSGLVNVTASGPDQAQKASEDTLSKMRMRLLGLVGVFGRRTRNRGGLLAVLRVFFPDCTFSVDEFIPRRRKLDDAPTLGKGQPGMRLGYRYNSILGATILDFTSTIRLTIGPLTFDQYQGFLPNGRSLAVLEMLLARYLPDDIGYELVCLIRSDTFPEMKLSSKKAKLGTSFWLGKPSSDVVRVDRHRLSHAATS